MEEMPTRLLGSTGERVSLIGMGGAHLGVFPSRMEAVRFIHAAIDSGITFLDNSWDYNSGESERRAGEALRHGYRDKVFLMTKVDGRTRDAVVAQLDESLRRLQTDHVDLLQLHEVIRWDDPQRTFAPGGAIEGLVLARDAGKVRYIGFTGHKDPGMHLGMLAHPFPWDTVQMPLNVLDAHFRSFEHLVLPVLKERRIGVLAMKPFCAGQLFASGTVNAIAALHYVMNLPVAVVITGMQSASDLQQALHAASTFRPWSRDRIAALLAKTAAAARGGRHEGYKTTDIFDSTAHNPEWLEVA